jgi:hypothetical protein
MTLQEIREGLRQCLVERKCNLCPYFMYFYDDDIEYEGQYSCWGRLQKDADEALLKLEI